MIAETQKALESIGSKDKLKTTSFVDATIEFLDYYECATQSDGALPVYVGIDDVDRHTGGFHPSEFVVVAGRPGTGKSCLALQLSQFEAQDNQNHVLYISSEMLPRELAQRSIIGATGVNSKKIRDRTLSDDDFTKIRRAASELSETKIDFVGGRLFVDEIVALARYHKRVNETSLVVVDLLGHVKVRNRNGRSRTEQISEVTNTLKDLAMSLEVVVVGVVQLNREADGQTPLLKHLKDSGAYEEDANVVLFLHRPGKCSSEETKLIVAKHRAGSTATVDLTFDKQRHRFSAEALPGVF